MLHKLTNREERNKCSMLETTDQHWLSTVYLTIVSDFVKISRPLFDTISEIIDKEWTRERRINKGKEEQR